MVTFAGKGEDPAGLWPPQAGKSRSNNKGVATSHAREPKRNLPMHPLVASRLIPMARRSMEWKTVSVEAGDGFSKLRRLAGVSVAEARSRNPERSEGPLVTYTESPLTTHSISLSIYPHFVPVSVGCKKMG